MTMGDTKNLYSTAASDKLKSLVDEIDICLLCSNLKKDDGASCRPMSTQEVCSQGNIWFFSERNSEKNMEILENNKVQLFYSHPGKSSYLIVNGEAVINSDKSRIEELWSPEIEVWFPNGKDDPNITLIKVVPTSAYYWDTDGNKMVNFIKTVASAVTGSNLIEGNEGSLTL